MLSESLIGVGWIVLSSRIGLLAPIRVTKISTAGGSALADCRWVRHGIVILANCPLPNSPLGNRLPAQSAAIPTRLLSAAALLAGRHPAHLLR